MGARGPKALPANVHMLRGNPSMVSKKFSEALEELKKSAVEYKKREKK